MMNDDGVNYIWILIYSRLLCELMERIETFLLSFFSPHNFPNPKKHVTSWRLVMVTARYHRYGDITVIIGFINFKCKASSLQLTSHPKKAIYK